MIDIRVMREDEKNAVRQLGRKTFEWFESIFISNPKKCYVAIKNDVLVGAVMYKYMKIGDKRIGYIDYLFIDKTVHGEGLGSQLIDTCLKTMLDEGCDGYSAIVRDDNVGSWKIFVNRGFQRIGLDDLTRRFGVSGLIGHSFKTPFNVATGMEYYLKIENETIEVKKENSFSQLFNYLIYTILMLMPTLVFGLGYAIDVIGSAVAVLSIRLIAGYIGTMFSNEKWYFRVTDGGYFIPLITSFLGGIYFISGNWYPRVYRSEQGFKRSLGLTSLAQLISLLCIRLLMMSPLSEYAFIHSMSTVAGILMIITMIPLYPVASFGGKRIYDWNKWIFTIIVMLAAAILYLT